MLQILSHETNQLETLPLSSIDTKAIWYDLSFPLDNEKKVVEDLLNIHIPSLEEMGEIEESSRLFEKDGVLYMTALIVTNAATEHVIVAPVTFILLKHALITVRYCDPKPFQNFVKKKAKNGFSDVETTFLALIDSIIARIADILEINFSNVNAISDEIFQNQRAYNQMRLNEVLQRTGKVEDLNSKVRESLGTLDRQLIFCQNYIGHTNRQLSSSLSILQQDVKSLIDFLTFLSHKINFLLDSTLGFIDIEQNAIIKIFSIAAVFFLPPMLISSIYGMNFKVIPELEWILGYPFALLLMVLSVIIAYIYFKNKKWL